MSRRYASDEDRILANITVDANGCFLWNKLTQRYGVLRYRGKTVKAHRFSYELFRGPIPEGMSVLHRCDVTSCCNPAHLFLGTQMDNMRDCANKGRIVPPSCPKERKARGDNNGMRKHPGVLSGERNGRSKLTDANRDTIRRLKRGGMPTAVLAVMFEISTSAVNRICRK